MFLTSLKRYIIKGKNNMDIRNDFSSPEKWGKIMREYGKKLKCPDTFFFMCAIQRLLEYSQFYIHHQKAF